MPSQKAELTRVLVTGAEGFLGKNLLLHLRERSDIELRIFTRSQSIDCLADLVRGVDFVFHLAGVNRPQDPAEFKAGNADLTSALVVAALNENEASDKPTIVFASSTQASLENPYGLSKRQAEDIVFDYGQKSLADVHVFRLPNVFGKWARPNYNSAVATFCHNIARELPIQIHDPEAPLSLVYVDDVMAQFLRVVDGAHAPERGFFATIAPVYQTTVGEVATKIKGFRDGRASLHMDHVGDGLIRGLYATYVSYLPVNSFSYTVPQHADARGTFVEILKTPDCGQFSFFTAHPGVTRGGHYHHSKTEKFLVIKGRAMFRFRHMQTGQFYELQTTGEIPEIVETVPGWTHDITNVGKGEMIVMLWANEVFDPERPDTYKSIIQ